MLLQALTTVVALATPQPGHSMRVEAIPVSSQSSRCQFRGDDMALRIYRGRTKVLSEDYCSAYGKGSARLIRDKRGRTFVLLSYSEGHGTHATADYLRVYELINGALYERAALLQREPIGPFRDLLYAYSVKTLPAGGLRIAGVSRTVGQRDRSLDLETGKRQLQTVLTIE